MSASVKVSENSESDVPIKDLSIDNNNKTQNNCEFKELENITVQDEKVQNKVETMDITTEDTTNNSSNNNNKTNESMDIVKSPIPKVINKQKKRVKSSKKKAKKKTKKVKKVHQRIVKELKDMLKSPPFGCQAGLKDNNNIMEWIGTIIGPPNTPYENGKFCLDIKFPTDYPFNPPKVTFKTRIYHCNVDKNGNICLDILKDKWSPALSVGKILLSITVLLTVPNPDDPLVADIAHLYKQNKNEHDKIAKEWTCRYASNPV